MGYKSYLDEFFNEKVEELFKIIIKERGKEIKVVGPPKSGKTELIKKVSERCQKELGRECEIKELTIGLKEGMDEKYSGEEENSKLEKALERFKEFLNSPIRGVKEEGITSPPLQVRFTYYFPAERIEGIEKYVNWEVRGFERIKYHLPKLLANYSEDEIKKQYEALERIEAHFGMKIVGIVTETTLLQSIVGIIKQYGEHFIEQYVSFIGSLATSLVSIGLSAFGGFMIGVILSDLIFKGKDRKAKRELLELALNWNKLDDDVKEIVATKLAIEMGLNSVEERDGMLKALMMSLGEMRRKQRERLKKLWRK